MGGLANVTEIRDKGEPRAPFQAPADLRVTLSGLADERHVVRGGCVLAAGRDAGGVYLVREGTVRACLPDDKGREIFCRTLGPGSLLGLPAAMCSKTYQFTANALSDLHLSFLSTEKLNDCLRRRTDLCMQVMSMMIDELAELRRTEEHMRSCTNPECSLYEACSRHSR